jgi:hypothetical protein
MWNVMVSTNYKTFCHSSCKSLPDAQKLAKKLVVEGAWFKMNENNIQFIPPTKIYEIMLEFEQEEKK